MQSSTGYPAAIKQTASFVGPYVISAFIQAIQTGILICLHITFWARPSEGKVIRYLVIFISLVGLYQTCLSVQQLWQVAVTNFGDWNIIFSWPLPNKISYLITSLIAVPVQLFLVRRCWLLWGKRRFLLVILGILVLAYIGITLMVTIQYTLRGSSAGTEYIVPNQGVISFPLGPRFELVLISPVVVDTVLTILLMIRLIQLRSSTHTRKFRKILNAVTMITWETAVPPSACAIATVALYGIGKESNFWFKAFRDVLGKLYIMSLMVTLNNRAYLTELDNKEVTLQLPSLLPVPVTERTQPRNATLNFIASVDVESKHTQITPGQDSQSSNQSFTNS